MAKPLRENPGLAISTAVHAALVAAVLIGFARPVAFHDALETIPVEVVDASELSQVMKGERTASQVKPQPRAEKPARIAEPKPQPALNEAKKDTPAPPSPLKRAPDPGDDPKKAEPKIPVPKTVALPPPRPVSEPRRPAPAASVKPPPPPARPEDPAEAEEALAPKKPEPKVEQKPQAGQPKNAPRKKTAPARERDQLAKLLEREDQKPLEKRPVEKPVPKPKSGDESEPRTQKFDPGDISKFLSKERPQRKSATGPDLQQVASLGTATASAAKMSPMLWDGLDSAMLEQYRRCWTFIGPAAQQKYIPEIRVNYAEDGSLASQPELLNPPDDPSLRALAESALRAVRRCDPLRIPERYRPYYDQWKGRVVRFNPEEML
jgi:colicin import membrane protein